MSLWRFPDAVRPATDFIDVLNVKAITDLVKQGSQNLTFKGKVVSFGVAKSGTYFFLNFSLRHQDALALAFHIENNPTEFTPEAIRNYVDKTVIVEGQVSMRTGNPQILVASLKQLTIVGDATAR